MSLLISRSASTEEQRVCGGVCCNEWIWWSGQKTSVCVVQTSVVDIVNTVMHAFSPSNAATRSLLSECRTMVFEK